MHYELFCGLCACGQADIELDVAYDAIGAIYSILQKHEAQRLTEEFCQETVKLSISVAATRIEALSLDVRNSTRGKAVLRRKI